MAAKGGYNNESHNHNDAGTVSVYSHHVPMLIDAGVGTYTRQTFSSERYSIWTMQSNYHNLPLINGVPQKFGSEYKATEVKVDTRKQTFSANIATAYPEEAAVEKWTRSYRLGKDRLTITDAFRLKEAKAANVVNFLVWGNVDLSVPGVISLEVKGEKGQLTYDSRQFQASIETIRLEDPRLSNVWSNEIYRISLTARQTVTAGTYTFTYLQK